MPIIISSEQYLADDAPAAKEPEEISKISAELGSAKFMLNLRVKQNRVFSTDRSFGSQLGERCLTPGGEQHSPVLSSSHSIKFSLNAFHPKV